MFKKNNNNNNKNNKIPRKLEGNYKETTRNLPLSGKASGMYVANYPFPNPHFYFDDHSL